MSNLDGKMQQDDAARSSLPSMDELMEEQMGFTNFKNGDIIVGTVESLDEQGALLNVGAKSEVLVPIDEIGSKEAKTLSVGDQISVYVISNGAKDGNIKLSKKKADYEKAWNDIVRAHEEDETLTAMVVDRVKGGLVVDLGMRGFLPASHVSTKNVNALDKFLGQSIRLKVIEVDRHRKRVVVSQKKAVEDEKKIRRDQTITTLEEGQIRRGVVRRVTDYGAFIDLGGIDGLLHVTEMSWGRVNHPSDVVKPGQKIDVIVLKYDTENEKISLGLKQILPDPWQHVDEFYSVGEEVEGQVSRIVQFGAFVTLNHGIEGIIPKHELADYNIGKAEEIVNINQKVHVKIINIRPGERRMTLSLRQVIRTPEEEAAAAAVAAASFSPQQNNRNSGVTIGDMLGGAFGNADEAAEEAEVVEVVEVVEVTPEVVETTEVEAAPEVVETATEEKTETEG
ncbi:MAG: 30S ribosomal protein S1 [bacterium]